MSKRHSQIIETALRIVLQKQSWTGERDVLWGDEAGKFIVQTPINPREVYYHNLPSEQHEVGVAVLDSDSGLLFQENSQYVANPPRITIGYPPRSRILHVKGTAKSQEALQGQGSQSNLEQYLTRVGSPTIHNLVDFQVEPTSPSESTAVMVKAGMYESPSSPGVKQRWAGGSLDLSTLISTLASGQHQLALIYFDTGTGTLGASTTTAATAVGTLPSRTELVSVSSITLSSGQLAVGVVYLYYGQTAIVQDDCLATLDPRLTWPSGVSGAASGVSYTPTSPLTGTNVQDALDEAAALLGGGSGAMSLITSGVVSGSPVSSISLTSIPQTSKHLLLIVHARSTLSALQDSLLVQLNADSTAGDYFGTELGSTGTNVAGVENIGGTATMALADISGGTATAGLFGGLILDLYDYTNTTKLKTGNFRNDWATSLTHNGLDQRTGQGTLNSTAAITRIDILVAGGNLDVGTEYELYGMG